ncbi:MAG: endonuclease/exonuclease/phosphatase family protein [Candidatus Thiodiazotropha sp.]
MRRGIEPGGHDRTATDSHSQATAGEEHLRVATYNVHRSIGTDGRHDVLRTAKVIRQTGASILALQEVEEHSADPGALARATGMSALPGHTITGPDSNYGNLLLTDLTVESSQSIDLSWGRREPRGLIDARLRCANGFRLRCLVTHLGLARRERIYQHGLLRALLSRDWSGPTLLMGDFNEWRPYAFTIRMLNQLLGRSHARRSFPSCCPLLPLDRIWIQPQNLLASLHTHRSREARSASDHLPVIAAISIASCMSG